MTFTKIQKIIASAILAVILFIANFVYLFTPTLFKVNVQRTNIQENDSIISGLIEQENKKQKMAAEKESLRYAFIKSSIQLPGYLVPEDFVIKIRNLAANDGVSISGLTFSDPVEYMPTEVRADFKISRLADVNKFIYDNFFKPYEVDKKKATTNELQLYSIKEDSAFNINLSFNYSGTYDGVKKFISDLENSENVTTVNSVTMSNGKTGADISGGITATLFGFKDSAIPSYSTWQAIQAKGKANLFDSVGTLKMTSEDPNSSDFDIFLDPVTYDGPSFRITKNGNNRSEVAGDNKDIEQAEIHLTNKGGKYYFKYKTQLNGYPSSYTGDGVEFTPKNGENVVIKVFSSARINNADKSGLNLTIYLNNIGRDKIKVEPYNDDIQSPRIKYKIQ